MRTPRCQSMADHLRSFLFHFPLWLVAAIPSHIPGTGPSLASATSDRAIRLLGQSDGEKGFLHRLIGFLVDAINALSIELQSHINCRSGQEVESFFFFWWILVLGLGLVVGIRSRRIEIGVFALLKCSFKEIYNVCHLSTSRVLRSFHR